LDANRSIGVYGDVEYPANAGVSPDDVDGAVGGVRGEVDIYPAVLVARIRQLAGVIPTNRAIAGTVAGDILSRQGAVFVGVVIRQR